MNENVQRLQDNPIDIKIKISAIWIAMMFVFAYVDIFGLMRAEFLEGLLAGEIIGTPFEVTQGFLIFALAYVTPASLMVFFSLVMRPKLNRIVNVVIASLYIVTIVAGCIGEGWIFYLIGSGIEVGLLAILVRMAWRWPTVSAAATA